MLSSEDQLHFLLWRETPDKRIHKGPLFSHGGGGPSINVFLRVYFDNFRQISRFIFRPSKQSSLSVFGVFADIRGGTPDKRIPEGPF